MHNRMEASRIIVARERRVELGAGGNHVGHFQYLGVDHRYSLFRGTWSWSSYTVVGGTHGFWEEEVVVVGEAVEMEDGDGDGEEVEGEEEEEEEKVLVVVVDWRETPRKGPCLRIVLVGLSNVYYASPTKRARSSHTINRVEITPTPEIMSRPIITHQRGLTLPEELEKLEQQITLTLQEIDSNFSKAHRIVTSSILPIVEDYAKHSNQVWEGSKV